MIRFLVLSDIELPWDWQANLLAEGIETSLRQSLFNTTIVFATQGSTHLLFEISRTRSNLTVMAGPSLSELELIDRLVQQGVAQYTSAANDYSPANVGIARLSADSHLRAKARYRH